MRTLRAFWSDRGAFLEASCILTAMAFLGRFLPVSPLGLIPLGMMVVAGFFAHGNRHEIRADFNAATDRVHRVAQSIAQNGLYVTAREGAANALRVASNVLFSAATRLTTDPAIYHLSRYQDAADRVPQRAVVLNEPIQPEPPIDHDAFNLSEDDFDLWTHLDKPACNNTLTAAGATVTGPPIRSSAYAFEV